MCPMRASVAIDLPDVRVLLLPELDETGGGAKPTIAATMPTLRETDPQSARSAHGGETDGVTLSAGSQRQTGGKHFVGEFAGAGCVQFAAQQTLDLNRLGVELLGEGTDTVAVSGQPGLEVIDLLRQHRLNHLRCDRLLADPEPFFECERQMPLDLQWCAQARDEQLDRSRCDQVTGLCTFGASLQQPSDVLTLLARDAVEGEQTGSIADFLHGRPAQVVPELGMPCQYHGEASAAVDDHLQEALQPDQRLRVKIVSLIHEQRDRLAAADQAAQFALAFLALLGDPDLALLREVVEQGVDQGGDRGALLIDGER